MPTYDHKARMAALDAAEEALGTLKRLHELRESRGELTTNQDRDFADAQAIYAEARSAVPELRELRDDGYLEDSIEIGERVIRGLRPIVQKEPRVAQLRSDLRKMFGEKGLMQSGSDDGFGDPIRRMIQEGTHAVEFDLVQGFRATAHRADETRAIADFSDSASLYSTDFAQRIAMYLRTSSPWFSVATVVRADNGRPLRVPTLTADSTTYTPGEGTAITESTPTLGTAAVTLTSYKVLQYVSQEAIEDVEYDLSGYLARQAARSISLSFGSAATTTVLAGINNGGTASGVGGNGTATSTFFGWEDLIDLKFSRAAPYRESAQWVMSNGSIKKVQKFKDQQSAYFWQPGAAGLPLPLLGAPVYEDPYLAAPASATKSVIYGDLASALVIKATSLRVEQSSEYRFNTDEVAFKVVLRAGIAVQDATAAAYLVSANS